LTACSPTSRAASTASAFDDRKGELQERLRQGPGAEAQVQTATTPQGPAPSRWTLATIRVTFDWLTDYTLSGLRRLLDRFDLGLHSANVQQFSPAPDYATKHLRLMRVLGQARRHPGQLEAIFLDEMGYTRWPDPGPDYGGPTPVADRRGANNGLWRLIGGLNARTGQLDYLDAYIVGRAKVIQFYQQLVAAYPRAERLSVIQDNWSIHTHPEVLAALRRWPQIRPVWLPTYAPWLNPIEKVWRWLRQDVLKLHRQADNWAALQERVHGFLDQFARGSERLLEYVGLYGQGRLARMINGP
jgi:transposase